MVLPFVKKERKRINCILPETKYRSLLGAGPTFKHSLQFASVILLLNRFPSTNVTSIFLEIYLSCHRIQNDAIKSRRSSHIKTQMKNFV